MKAALYVLAILLLLALTGCKSSKADVSEWIYHSSDDIDYNGIRTEARKNKVRSEMDK